MNLHIPPDLSWHQRPKRSSPNCLLPSALALQLPRLLPPTAHPTPGQTVCARAKGTLLLISSLVAGRRSYSTSLHFTSAAACYTSPRVALLPVAGSLRACPPATRLLTESTARQPRNNATGLATLIVSAPDNLCLVGQVQAVQPRPLSAIPVPVCLT